MKLLSMWSLRKEFIICNFIPHYKRLFLRLESVTAKSHDSNFTVALYKLLICNLKLIKSCYLCWIKLIMLLLKIQLNKYVPNTVCYSTKTIISVRNRNLVQLNILILVMVQVVTWKGKRLSCLRCMWFQFCSKKKLTHVR